MSVYVCMPVSVGMCLFDWFCVFVHMQQIGHKIFTNTQMTWGILGVDRHIAYHDTKRTLEKTNKQ